MRRNSEGILIYTAAADSDGTLGGLVDLGKPENLGRLLEQALSRSKICSSDPLCSEHDPEKDRSLHAAACHACSLVAETSCERGNRYLDRSLLVRTLVPASRLYAWRDKTDPFSDGRVHAKVAVADGRMCFITSANLTGHAMEKNMEAGVLISGGHIPRLLDDHLRSLVDTKLVSPV